MIHVPVFLTTTNTDTWKRHWSTVIQYLYLVASDLWLTASLQSKCTRCSFRRDPLQDDSVTVPPVCSCAGAYVCKGRSGWLMPLGEALCENADLQLSIPTKFRRAPPLPPPPGPAMCALLLDMLAADPNARPPVDQLESRVRSALSEDSHWHKVGYRDHNGGKHWLRTPSPPCSLHA